MEKVVGETLCKGYVFSVAPEIDYVELAELLEAATGECISGADMQEFSDDLRADGAKMHHVQVRNWLGKLAGNGTLWYVGHEGMLANLVVHPDDQHKGIARFITSQRLKIAAKQQLSYIVTQLDPANTLEPYYLEYGFCRASERENPYDGFRILTYGTEE